MEENIKDDSVVPIRFLLYVTVIIITTISFYTNITKPRLWIDEGKSVELARNFMNFGVLDIQTSPGRFSDIAPSMQSTGYPVTIPLAAFFKVFGLGPHQARIYMQVWLVSALLSVFFLAKNIFVDKQRAFLSFLLIASFASFYDSGRTVVGEIPGLVFLLIGLYYWIKKDDYYKTGLAWGLAVVTKPSVFALIIPTIVIALFETKIEYLKKIYKVAVGMIPSAILWFVVVIQGSLGEAFTEISEFYKNPYSSSISENILRNLQNLPFQTTIIYFSGLMTMVLTARYLARNSDIKIKQLYNFIIIYSGLALTYYLRSPGWLRYILIAEILILFILPEALNRIVLAVEKIPADKKLIFTSGGILLLVIMQTVQMFTVADIFYSDNVPRTISYINSNFPTSTVATFQVIEASAFLKTDQRFNQLTMTGMPIIGSNPLNAEILPEIVLIKNGEIEQWDTANILESKYALIEEFGPNRIYKIKFPQ